MFAEKRREENPEIVKQLLIMMSIYERTLTMYGWCRNDTTIFCMKEKWREGSLMIVRSLFLLFQMWICLFDDAALAQSGSEGH